MLFTPLGLDHVALGVRDHQATQKFHTEVLGCTVERTNPEISLIQLRFGEHVIDLMPGSPSGNGLRHYCLSIRCDDLTGLADALRAKGVEVEGEIAPCTGAWGRSSSLFIRDPNNYVIELKPR
jgi:glyoxylase I family protein